MIEATNDDPPAIEFVKRFDKALKGTIAEILPIIDLVAEDEGVCSYLVRFQDVLFRVTVRDVFHATVTLTSRTVTGCSRPD